jgi:hypothetical protein
MERELSQAEWRMIKGIRDRKTVIDNYYYVHLNGINGHYWNDECMLALKDCFEHILLNAPLYLQRETDGLIAS